MHQHGKDGDYGVSKLPHDRGSLYGGLRPQYERIGTHLTGDNSPVGKLTQVQHGPGGGVPGNPLPGPARGVPRRPDIYIPHPRDDPSKYWVYFPRAARDIACPVGGYSGRATSKIIPGSTFYTNMCGTC